MKRIRKILSVILVLMLSLTATLCSACDFKLNLFGREHLSYETEQEDPAHDPSGEGDEGGEGEEGTATLPDNVSFYRYLDRFDAAQTSLKLDITSVEMFAAYIDYVHFYVIKNQVDITLKYSNNFSAEYTRAIAIYDAGEHVPMGYSAQRSYLGSKGKYYISESSWEHIAEETLDEEKEYVYPQTDYAFKMPAPTEPDKRAEDFDGFKLDSVTKELKNISNSEQLRWAIQNGYKPKCKAGSAAESVLNKAKAVLRDIVTDEMDDFTKLRAIYEWLALSVQYDNLAADTLKANPEFDATVYDSWYAEGVFDNNKAVCEGYAKAFIILAGLEGIPAIFVSGNGHAWNRVLLDGNWYVLDATHADVHVGEKEVFSYGQFLITDAEKTNRGYTSEDYKNCAAVTEFNAFELMKYDYLSEEFDLSVDSKAELRRILLYGKSRKSSGVDSTVDFFVKSEYETDFDNWATDITVTPLYKSTLSPDIYENNCAHYVFYLS